MILHAESCMHDLACKVTLTSFSIHFSKHQGLFISATCFKRVPHAQLSCLQPHKHILQPPQRTRTIAMSKDRHM